MVQSRDKLVFFATGETSLAFLPALGFHFLPFQHSQTQLRAEILLSLSSL